MNITNTTGFRGVTLLKENNKFVAGISHEGKRINLGMFKTAEAAALAYDQKAKELRGPWAVLNFPDLDLDTY